MSLKTDNRAKQILKILLQHGNTSVDELVSQLEISPASIRRDLTRLETRGLVHRTHGGATLAGQMTYEPFRFDSAFPIREDRFAEEKRHIALAAAELIQREETIGLAAGTTTTQLARSIRHRTNIHVVTNAVNIGMELANQQGLKVTLTGGTVQWPGAFSMVGPTAFESLQRIFFDRVFLGVCGIDPEHGATVIEEDESLIFRSMAEHAKQVIIVADSSKIGMISPALICPINKIDTVVTDDGISADLLAAFRSKGVEVIVA
jgi:DeoR family transcriptional regulator, aga operon transcriptional repressor